MRSDLSVFCITVFPLCFGFLAESEYPYLFTVVINKEFVPDQKQLRVCAAIELVENVFYLLPKRCFDGPSSNEEIRVALLRKKRLKFSPLVYESFIIRWESFSDYVILEKNYDSDPGIVVVSGIRKSAKSSRVINITENGFASNIPQYNLVSTEEREEITYEPALERRKRYMKYKAHFKNRQRSLRKERLDEQPIRFPPFIENEDKLPPRILLTVPNSPLIRDCFIIGWGTFFAGKKELKQLDGLELRRNEIKSIKLGATDDVTGFRFSEIWFEREKGQKYVEDLGSPLVCKVKERGNVEVIIGLFMGGNSSMNHKFDSYRSFMGEFHYITHWAIGTNVSITGDPATWTLWPVDYHEEPKSRGVELKFRYVPKQQHRRVCSAIMLVEDIFYLTARSCFDGVLHDQKIKIAMSRKTEPIFDILIYEDFIMKTRDLHKFLILRKDGFDLVVGSNRVENDGGLIIKNPYLIDDLSEPRVLLTHPDNPSFTHCFCLGWGSYTQGKRNLSNLNLKFTSSGVHSTKLKVKQDILVERVEGENAAEDYGSPLLCEERSDGKIRASAVVGMFIGGDIKMDSTKTGLVTYTSFSGALEPLTRWAIGTNVCITENLSEWTLWPFYLSELPDGDSKKRSGANYSIQYEYLCISFSLINSIQYFLKHYT